MNVFAGGEPALTWLAVFVAVLVVQRVGELWLSGRHEVRLRALGAREHAREHFPLLVLVHVLFPLALIAEVTRGAVEALALRPGLRVFASFKASGVVLVP